MENNVEIIQQITLEALRAINNLYRNPLADQVYVKEIKSLLKIVDLANTMVFTPNK